MNSRPNKHTSSRPMGKILPRERVHRTHEGGVSFGGDTMSYWKAFLDRDIVLPTTSGGEHIATFKWSEDRDHVLKMIASYEALLDALTLALPYVESALEDKGYKPGAVNRMVKQIREAIEGGMVVNQTEVPGLSESHAVEAKFKAVRP